MNSLKVKAKFIGQDGSCGYKNGYEYDLLIRNNQKGVIIEDYGIAGICKYESTVAFLKNWTNIEVL